MSGGALPAWPFGARPLRQVGESALKVGHRIVGTLAFVVAATGSGPSFAQGFIEFLRGGAPAYAPDASRPASAPLSIAPVSPAAGDIALPRRIDPRTRMPTKAPVVTPAPTGNPFEEDEDSDVVFEHDTPKRVAIALPEPRPGARPAAASEVAPTGGPRWSDADDQLPPGAEVPGVPQAPPQPPRLAALPDTRIGPSWTTTDAPLRPPGLRQSEAPVPTLPGVYAPPEASFDCLPEGLKQVLLDTAKEFGHVAILNARRPRGSGARASYHYQCRAVDFRVRGAPVAAVYAYLRQHPQVGGRKIYPFGFFHVDDGPSRSW